MNGIQKVLEQAKTHLIAIGGSASAVATLQRAIDTAGAPANGGGGIMQNVANFFSHPAESIGGFFQHPGEDVHSAFIGVQKNPEIALAIAAVFAPYVALAYGGAGYFGGMAADAAYAGAAASPYLESAVIGTYGSGAMHGFGGLSSELSSGPTSQQYMTGAEFAAAYGIGSFTDAAGGFASRLGAGFVAERGLSAMGIDPFGAPTLGPNATAQEISNAQLQSDITGQPIQYQGNQSASASGSSSGGGVGAPGAGGSLSPGGGAINTTGLVALAALAFVAAEA
jgi:hypothetical protein